MVDFNTLRDKKKNPPPPPKRGTPPAAAAATTNSKTFGISRGRQVGAQRILVYGPGGVGKTELCSLLPDALFLDLEHGSEHFDVARAEGVETFNEVRAWLQTPQDHKQRVIDTVTKLEEVQLDHMRDHISHEKPGTKITGIESYGFGKGYQHRFELMSLFLADCDHLIRKGTDVILIAHSCAANAPNPHGEDWLRWEPQLQAPKKQANIRDRIVGWADHVIFIGYDVAVGADGRGVGGGTRTIYTTELPTHIAKTRGAFKVDDAVPEAMAYEQGDDTIWQLLLGGAK